MAARAPDLPQALERALDARAVLPDPDRHAALRLFNGFSEGCPGLVVELYGRTLVLFNHAAPPGALEDSVQAALAFYRARLPWLDCAVLKTRAAADPVERCGRLLFGLRPARRLHEDGVRYALDLTLNQDASIYLDTRALRAWLRANSAGGRVLNTFAYTGSLGAAARAGGAAQVVQVDLNRRFLNLAKETWALNGWPVRRADFLAEDFFRAAARLRRARETFDLVLLDPPFFSTTPAGRVDLVGEAARLVNKTRPLVRPGGRLVVVNNALYLPGAAWMRSLEQLCAGGLLQVESLIPVPQDVTGPLAAPGAGLPADPTPWNHATKITVLRVLAPPEEEPDEPR